MSVKDGLPRKRIGRPPTITHGPRIQLGIIVSAELRNRIEQRAESNGTSMSQEAEHIILQGLAVVDVIESLRKTLKLK
jgi:hypothetical protein